MMNTINTTKTLDNVIQFLSDPNMAFPKVDNGWGADLMRYKGHAVQCQAIQKLIDLKSEFDLPPHYREELERQINKLNLIRKRDRCELDRRMRDIRRVQKIITDLEQHRQSYLSQVHMFGDADMTMDLAQRERHRNRLAEWEDEINFRNAMLEQLRAKAKNALNELNTAEQDLVQLLESQRKFRDDALQVLSGYNWSPSVQMHVLESSLNEGQVVFIQQMDWEFLSSTFSMTMLRQLQHHFKPMGTHGYMLRSDWRYYSFLNDVWILGDSEAEGLSFENPSLQFAIKAELSKHREKEDYDQRQFLRILAEHCISGGKIRFIELNQWLAISKLFGQAYWPSLIMFGTVIKTYQLEQRCHQIDRLLEMAKADGVVRREESDLLKSIEKQLIMPDARPPQLEKIIHDQGTLELLPSKEELLEQVCRMAMCDDELHASEALCLKEILKDLGLDAHSLENHLKRQVS